MAFYPKSHSIRKKRNGMVYEVAIANKFIYSRIYDTSYTSEGQAEREANVYRVPQDGTLNSMYLVACTCEHIDNVIDLACKIRIQYYLSKYGLDD